MSWVVEEQPRFCGICGRALKKTPVRMGFNRQTGTKIIETRYRCNGNMFDGNHEDWAPVGIRWVNIGGY